MQLIPYLNFNGQCAAAFQFYEKCLGGKAEIMTFGNSPMAKETPPESHSKVMHASLAVGDAILMGSNGCPGGVVQSKGSYVALVLKDLKEAQRIFEALTTNGTVEMPLTETFWAAGFATFVDQFGTPWMINCERAA
ncbi:MAG: VOC family protein [Bryobacterales bacterium]